MTLFFDLDGPLLDVSPRYAALHQDLLHKLGFAGLDAATYWKRKRAVIPEDDILAEIAAESTAAEYLRLRLEQIETEEYLTHDIIWPWAIPVLTLLAARDPLVLVTARTWRDRVLTQLAKLNLYEFFDEVLTTPAEGKLVGAKKAEAIAGYLLKQGQPTEGHFMIGDTEADIEAGKRLGLTTVAVLSGIRDEERLRACQPDHLIADIRALPALIGM